MENTSKLSFNERVAIWLTMQAGTMRTFWVLVGWYLSWILVNLVLGRHAFDPSPFAILLFISNALQLWWLPALSVGQSIQLREGRKRQEENDQILRNQVVTMQALLRLAERDVALAQEASEALKAIQHEIAD